jgi:hypothetical protein
VEVRLSDPTKNNLGDEDLFDFPVVEGFSHEFIEAARTQTQAASTSDPCSASEFDDQGELQASASELPGDAQEEPIEDEFTDDFADEFTDLMGDSAPEPADEPVQEEQAVAVAAASVGFDHRFVWGALTLLLVANLFWAWSWHSSESRLRGEMDQRFQGYLAQQRTQLDGVVTALTTEESTEDVSPFRNASVSTDAVSPLIEEIKRDLVHARYETARAHAWRLIGRVDSFPVNQRSEAEAEARLLIGESYELQGTDLQETDG